jgi:hypothetical protein
MIRLEAIGKWAIKAALALLQEESCSTRKLAGLFDPVHG